MAIAGSVIKMPLNILSDCPPIVYIGNDADDIERALAQYDEWNAEYEDWLAKLPEAVVGSEEYNYILQMISYYSALKDNYFNLIIVAVMNDEMMRRLDDETINDEEHLPVLRSSGLPVLKNETLRYLFAYRNHYTDNLSIVETYLAENNFEEALETLSNIYKQFDLKEEQVNELRSLQEYIQWLQQLEEKEETIYKLSENEIEYLVKYVENNTGRGVAFAKNILCVLYGICMEDEVSGEQFTGNGEDKEAEGGKQKAESEEENLTVLQFSDLTVSEKITVVPNPTSGELTIRNYELQIEKIEVLDMVGKVVLSYHLITPSSNPKIDISNLNSGIYFIKVVTDHGNTVKKIVKQ
jgi:hypothetical protein